MRLTFQSAAVCALILILTPQQPTNAFQPTITTTLVLQRYHHIPPSHHHHHHHHRLDATTPNNDATTPNNPNQNTTPPQPQPTYPNRLTTPPPSPSTLHPHRSGFLSLIGAPNMGKSTLLNALLSENLCAVTPRPQTTRHAILGVLTSDDPDQLCQLCFRDTPGVIGEPAYKLQEGMMEAVKGAFVDSDVIVVVTDLFGTVMQDDVLFEKVAETDKTVVVVVNKVDLADRVTDKSDGGGKKKGEEGDGNDTSLKYKRTVKISSAVRKWRTLLPNALAVIPLTASNGGTDPGVVALRTLLLGGPDVPGTFRNLGRPVEGMFRAGCKTVTDEEAKGILPVGPPLYDVDALTDRSERFFASEIIRASLFGNLGKEIPYCCEVRIAQFIEPKPNEPKQVIKITADICVERDSQKGIVVGKGGQKIKDVGVDARKELEEFLQGKVHLQLHVKVEKDWRKDEDKLKAYGYLK